MDQIAAAGGDTPSARHEVAPLPGAHPAWERATGIVHRFVRDLVYGANDGIITTFAVVAGVSGASLSARIVLIMGVANLVADGFSMGASNWLGIRSERAARDAHGGAASPESESTALAHGVATFAAFVVAGAVPLVAYLLPISDARRFAWSCALALGAQFVVGAARTVVTRQRWWTSGLEMLAVGVAAGGVAWATGRWLATLTGTVVR